MNFLTILDNVSTQKPLIALISIINTLDSKIKKCAPELSLIKASDRHENEDTNINKVGWLTEWEFIQIEDIWIGNILSETLLSKNVNKFDPQKIVDSDSSNISSVY